MAQVAGVESTSSSTSPAAVGIPLVRSGDPGAKGYMDGSGRILIGPHAGTTMAEWALKYAEHGYAVFQLAQGSKFPKKNCPACDPKDKERFQESLHENGQCTAHPNGMAICHGHLAATRDPKVITAWWQSRPHCNIGINVGRSGLAILDVDTAMKENGTRKTGDQTMQRLRAEYGEMPSGPVVRTRSGGWQHYLRHPNGMTLISSAGRDDLMTGIGQDVDVKALSAYVVAPPSLIVDRQTGLVTGQYTWTNDPWLQLPDVPLWIPQEIAERQQSKKPPRTVSFPAQYGGAASTDEVRQRVLDLADKVIRTPEGARNDTLFRKAATCIDYVEAGQIDGDEVESIFISAGLASGLDYTGVCASVASARHRPNRRPYVYRSRAERVAYGDDDNFDVWASQDKGSNVVDIAERRDTVSGGSHHTTVISSDGQREERLTAEAKLRILAEHGTAEVKAEAQEKLKKVDGVKDPIPLDEDQLPTYDLERFRGLGTYAKAVGQAMGIAPEIPLGGALGALSTAIGGRRTVKIRNLWTESVCLYCLTIADSGSVKSAGQKAAIDALKKEMERRRIAEVPEIEMDQSRRRIAEGKLKEAETAFVKAKSREQENEAEADLDAARSVLNSLGPERMPLRLFADDATAETLPGIMAPQGERIAVIEPEGTFLKNISGFYSNGQPNVDLVLKAYGHESHASDRVSTNRPDLHQPSMTISMAIQGDAITKLGKATLAMDGKGFWGRFMYLFPRPSAGTRSFDVPDVPADIVADYEARLLAVMKACYDDSEIKEMTLSEEARELFAAYYEATDPKVYSDKKRVPIQGWLSKQAGRVARIAACLALYEDATTLVVSGEVMADAIALNDVMIAHARKAASFMTLNDVDPLEPARQVLAWLQEKQPYGMVKNRTVFRSLSGRAMFRRQADIDAALDVLAEYHWIAYDPQNKGQFLVHPVIAGDAPETAGENPVQEVAARRDVEFEEDEAEGTGEDALEQLSALLGRFVRDRCEVGPKTDTGYRVTKDEFQASFEEWHGQGVDKMLLGKALLNRVAKGAVEGKRPKINGVQVQAYVGIRIKD
jgi:hypothetical protein